MGEFMGGGFVAFIGVFLIILALLWFLLPFAIFGTKDKLDEIIHETKKTNALLERIANK